MTTACEAVFENGVLRPTHPVDLSNGQRVRLMILDETATPTKLRDADVAMLLSEESLGRVWNSPEEDEAWADL